MRILLIVLMVLGFGIHLMGQDLVRVFPERGRDDIIQFIAENNTGRTQHVYVVFDFIINARASTKLPYSEAIRPGRAILFKIQPAASGDPDWDYRYYVWDGVLNPEVRDVEYVLPTSETKQTIIKSLRSYKNSKDGDPEKRTYVESGIAFKMNKGDTVFSVRAGTVHRIVSKGQNGKGSSYGFTKDKSYIQILHRDGTIATYLRIDDNSLMVEPQQFIPAGTPLAKFNGSTDYDYLNLLIHYWYLDLSESQRVGQSAVLTYFIPTFATSDARNIKLESGNSYQSLMTAELMLQELTKREIKLYAKGKLK